VGGRVDLVPAHLDDAAHHGVGERVLRRVVDAPAGGLEVRELVEEGPL